ncbi:MAG: flagellar biosynthesis anti-sigma factor FlgM [Angelakisella sp.]
MKIDATGAIRAYTRTPAVTPKAAQPQEARPGMPQQDRIAISSAAHQNAAQKTELDKLVRNTAAEVEASVSTARLDELRQSVAAGEYRVPTERLTEAILNAFV